MNGLKSVRHRHDDALTRVGWDQLEVLLADHYREQGWEVEHVGTGVGRARFDGGVDLKLRRQGEYVLVQCKHWNAKQVTHNAVHELLGIKINQNATGAIVVSSGEFTQAAIEAASRQGHVQLIDGNALRAMLGARLDALVVTERPSPPRLPRVSQSARSGREQRRKTPMQRLGLVVGALVFAFVLYFGLNAYLRHVGVFPHRIDVRLPQSPTPLQLEKTRTAAVSPKQPMLEPAMTGAELDEWKRRNLESMRILEQNELEQRERESR